MDYLIATIQAMKTEAWKFRAPCREKPEEAISADLLGSRVPGLPRDGINWEESVILKAHLRTVMATKEATPGPDTGI